MTDPEEQAAACFFCLDSIRKEIPAMRIAYYEKHPFL
jgi:hypothetical protein